MPRISFLMTNMQICWQQSSLCYKYWKNTDWSPHKWCIQSNGVWLSGESRRSIIWKGSDQFWTEEGAFEYIFHHLKRFSCFQHPWLRLGRLWPKFRHRTSSLRTYVNVHVPVCCFVTGQTCLCRITLQCTNYTYAQAAEVYQKWVFGRRVSSCPSLQ